MYVDPCIQKEKKDVREKAEELGWIFEKEIKTCIIRSSDWGELKKKISDKRSSNHFFTAVTESEEINQKASKDPRLDMIISAQLSQESIKNMSENSIAVGLNFRKFINTSRRDRNRVLSKWNEKIEKCERNGTNYIITTFASQKSELRPPSGLKSLVNSMGGNGEKAISTAKQTIEKNKQKLGGE